MSDTPASGFGKFVPGFEFLQGLATQAAGGIAQGLGQKLPSLPSLGHWVAPTFSVEELDKRIEELRAVQFWLDQNAKALGATIQALEVQKMTLSTLKSMNFSMGDVASALHLKPGEGATPSAPFPAFQVPPRASEAEAEAEAEAEEEEAPAPAPPKRAPRRTADRKAAAAASAAPAAGGVVDPLQWWGALSQQFQQIAANAMKDAAQQTALDATRQVASGLTDAALKTASGMGRAAARAVASAAQPAKSARPGRSAQSGKGPKPASKTAKASQAAPARRPAAGRTPRR